MGASPVVGIAYGADYNPEQWDRSVWVEDLRLMEEAGVNLVSVGVFSWSALEPTDGRFDFGWLDDVLNGLAGAGIKANLANATASPPPWLTKAHPEVLPVHSDGSKQWPGGRQAYCPSSPVFREHSLRLTREIAFRYSGHPALAMWHVSNEIGNHNIHCYCDVSAARFRLWLQEKYGDLASLNAAWGTTFWSQSYSDWDEIIPPRQTAPLGNPTQQIDFERFSSDESLAVYVAERDVLREITPDIPITTNLLPDRPELDYWSWAPELDVIAADHYLLGYLEDSHVELAMAADLSRGLAGGRPWMLMEHSTSAVNWQPRNRAKQPGEMLRNSLQHVARGSDSVMFFQWRASRFGAEKYHSAMVPHAGTDSKIWREVVQLGGILGRLADIAGTTVDADVAMVFDWQSGWGLDRPFHPSVDVAYRDQVFSLYRSLWAAGVTVDLVSPQVDLSGYRLLVIPSLYITTNALGSRVEDFVRSGGSVVATYMSGLVDENLHIHPGPYPGPLRTTLGLTIEEFYPLRQSQRVSLDDGSQADIWTELVRPEGAAVVSSFVDGPLPGAPAITVNSLGGGSAWYLATHLGQERLNALIKRILRELKIKPPIPMATAPAGLEAVRRHDGADSYLFLINHGEEPAHIAVTGHELVQNRSVEGRLTLRAGECAVVKEAI